MLINLIVSTDPPTVVLDHFEVGKRLIIHHNYWHLPARVDREEALVTLAILDLLGAIFPCWTYFGINFEQLLDVKPKSVILCRVLDVILR